MTTDLHTIQTTDRGASIVWTHALNNALMGDLLGKRGKPVAGFVAAAVRDGKVVGPVKHINGLAQRLV